MHGPFFPNTAFAWLFCLALAAILAVAARIDFRLMVIPKWITLSLLGSGIAVSVVRGVWVGATGARVWLFDDSNWWLGGLDGLLFALAGSAAGFGMLFLLWVLGTCGGGDVK